MILYHIKNINNGKKYIGQTVGRFCKRKANHLWQLRNNKHDNPYLQNSFNKYGEEVFEFKVIGEFDCLEELNKQEIKLIEEEGEYNLLTGGKNGGGDVISDETRKKLAEIHKGRKLTKEHIEKLRQVNLGERQSSAKLTNKEVKNIKLKLKEPYHGINKDLAKKYNVTASLISMIRHEKRWQHIKID